ncbi:MAG: molybdopterin-dependent oxidoreductase, partial [Deltaproteobacteria bacterium]|nr:molybdopterin-dependent oxidoreductase [Deltaproteobacteria bacterium]
SDFKDFKTMVLDDYSPEKAAPITGLAPKEIVSLARDFAGAKAPVAVYGKGKGSLNGALHELMAVQGLNALVGNINKPGGVLVHDPLPLSPLPETGLDAIAGEGLRKPRLDGAGSKEHPFTLSLIGNLGEAIKAAPESPVDTLLVFSANPVFTLPDGGAFKQALKKVPFIVSFSPFRDETSYMADLIMPDHTYLEKMDDIVWPTGLQYPLYGLSKPVVAPVYDTRNTGDVMIQLAKGIGNSVSRHFPWDSYEDVLKARAKGLYDAGGGLVAFDGAVPVWELQKKGTSTRSDFNSFDDMVEKLKSGGAWYKPGHTYGVWAGLFKTPNGKFEFSSSKIELALKGNGTGEKAGAAHSKADRSAYPLTMVPYEMINLASGWVPGPPFLNKTLFDDQLSK